MIRPLAGCHLTAPLQAPTPLHRAGLPHAPACLRCRLLTSAGRSGRMAPPAVLPWYAGIPSGPRRRLDNVRPVVAGGLRDGVPTRPERTTPPSRFVALAPHL